jgi:hypothetical protein
MAAERDRPSNGSPGSDDLTDLPTLRQTREQSALKSVAGIVSGVVAFLISRRYPAVGLFLVLMVACGALGAFLGKRFLKAPGGLHTTLAWLTLIAWVFPFFGALVVGAVWGGQDPARPVMRDRVLMGVCAVLTVVNGILGTLGFGRP